MLQIDVLMRSLAAIVGGLLLLVNMGAGAFLLYPLYRNLTSLDVCRCSVRRREEEDLLNAQRKKAEEERTVGSMRTAVHTPRLPRNSVSLEWHVANLPLSVSPVPLSLSAASFVLFVYAWIHSAEYARS